MSIYVWNSQIKNVYVWTTPVKEVYVWTTKVRPQYKTFTISWTEQSNMSSWWTYSDDATWLTAWSSAFDDFFWYSAVRLNWSWVETAEQKQITPWVLDITKLGTLTSWDNVMIKFPVRWIKMSKSWSVVTLSITNELNKSWYQYYAFNRNGSIQNNLYIGAYKWYSSSNVIKSWSGKTPTWNQSVDTFRNRCVANGTNYWMLTIWQRWLICAYYIMKYWNTNSQLAVWYWYVDSSSARSTWWTDSQTNATYWTTANKITQSKIFWLEDMWGNFNEFLDGLYRTSSWLILANTSNNPTSIANRPSAAWGDRISLGTYTTDVYAYLIKWIQGTNTWMFLCNSWSSSAIADGYSSDYLTYYCDSVSLNKNIFIWCWWYNDKLASWIFNQWFWRTTTDTNVKCGARLVYL